MLTGYCEFQNEIYISVVATHCQKATIKIYCLNEEHLCWEFCSDHVILSRMIDHRVISSATDLYFIAAVDLSEDIWVNEILDRMYCYDPYSKTLLFWKETYLSGNEHLFVPDYLTF